LRLDQETEREGISASAYKSCERCVAKWAFIAIAKYPREETPATKFGKKGHGFAENYLKFGITPDQTCKEGRTLIKGLHLLPKPGTVLVEEPFAFRFGGVLWDGYKDWQLPHRPLVGDHKFIADTNRFALSESELLNDHQAMIYGMHECIKFRSLQCELDWVWYPKSKGEIKRTYLGNVPYVHCRDHVEKMLPLAQYMVATRALFRKHQHLGQKFLTDAINMYLPKNRAACFDYSRQCPHIEYCT